MESSYGGLDHPKAFVDACYARGIAVLLDVLYNHWGPSDLDLWQYDGWSENGFGGIFFYNDPVLADTPWDPPRLRSARGAPTSATTRCSGSTSSDGRTPARRHQVHAGVPEAGIDILEGWSLMQWINESIDATQPWKITIAEDWGDNDWMSKSVGEGRASKASGRRLPASGEGAGDDRQRRRSEHVRVS